MPDGSIINIVKDNVLNESILIETDYYETFVYYSSRIIVKMV